MSTDIAKEAVKPTPAQLVAEASVVVRLAVIQWRPAYALAQTIATIGDLQSAVTDLAAENARLQPRGRILEFALSFAEPALELALEMADMSEDDELDEDDEDACSESACGVRACMEAGCIRAKLRHCRAALSPAPAKKENERG